MLSSLDWVRLLLGFVGTLAYTMVGITIGKRRISDEAVLGMRAFQAWWFGLAVLTLFAPLMNLLDLLPADANLLTVRIFLLEAVLVLLMLAVGGLVYYLFYVYVGKRWVVWPVAAYAFAELVLLQTIIVQAHPIDYGAHCPGGGFCYEHEFSGTPLASVLSYSLTVPILIGAVAYFALFFRVEERAQKRRVAMVAGALVFWFGSSFLASLIKGRFETTEGSGAEVSLNEWVYWRSVVSPLISLTAALIIYLAYRRHGGEATRTHERRGARPGSSPDAEG